MAHWLCIKCMHEFPDDDKVKRNPEYVGMALFVAIGIGGLLFAAGAVYTVLFAKRSADILVYGGLAAVAGIAFISMGLHFGKGVKAICPACGKPQGVPVDSRIANEVRQQRAKQQAKREKEQVR